jgi:hypothetical protein
METSDTSAKSFLQLAYSVSHKGGKSVLVMEETLWGKKNLNFVKDVHMTCVNFITNIIIVAEEKKGGITFIQPPTCISYCIHHLIHSLVIIPELLKPQTNINHMVTSTEHDNHMVNV